ncbi:MAG: nucleotidyltransferase family protein [Anaerolineales bacterium]|nr:nucleotidyltransferase family protein [Anaerolineales bacterium]
MPNARQTIKLMTASPDLNRLLDCLRLEDQAEKLARLKNFTDDDWKLVYHQARRHELISLLYGALNHPGDLLALPDWLRESLRQHCLHTTRRNLLLQHEISTVLPQLEAAGIPAIILKGLHLAELVYQDISLRPMVDVDLLVKEQHLEAAGQIMTQAGFTPYLPLQFEHPQSHHHLPPFCKPGIAVIEIHWGILPPAMGLNIDLTGLWQRARPVSIAGISTLTLSPEDLLLHLCVHFHQHNFKLGLKHLYDIAAALKFYRGTLDWDQIILRAQQWGASKQVFLVLHLAHELLNAPAPAQMLASLEPVGFNAQIEAMIRSRVLKTSGQPIIHPELVRLRSSLPLKEKISAFLRTVFPPSAYLARMYHLPLDSKIVYLYYFVRLKDLLGQYGRQIWLMLRNDPGTQGYTSQENMLDAWLTAP